MSPLPPDPYKILGVSKDAQIPEIRSAHRKLVLKCHPDKVQDPKLKAEKQDEFQKVQQAYELLSDDKERQKYDDKVKLSELRKQMQDKGPASSPRSSSRYAAEYEIRSPDLRSPSQRASPSGNKTYSYRKFDDEYGPGIHIFETTIRSSSRKDSAFADKPSKRESERERERQKDLDRERRRKESDRRAAAEAKAEKAERERKAEKKRRDKDKRRGTEDKQRSANPVYVSEYEDDAPRRRSSSRKYDEKRERYDSSREDLPSRPPLSRPPPMPRTLSSADRNFSHAQSYIETTRAKAGGMPTMQRSASYSAHNTHLPSAPTPPAAKESAFPIPDKDDDERVYRSSAGPSRRGSADNHRSSKERVYRKASVEEVLEDRIPATASPAARYPAQFVSSASSPKLSSSPRMGIHRTNTTPIGHDDGRPIPPIGRSQTWDQASMSMPRGRNRDRNQSQNVESSESDEDRHARDRKHRSSRKTRSPEPPRTSRYAGESGSRSRRMDSYPSDYPGYHSYRVSESRMPAVYSYSSSPNSRHPGPINVQRYDDVTYSRYEDRPSYRRDYPAYAAA